MKTTQEMIEVMQAYEDGKAIQFQLNGSVKWFVARSPSWDWSSIDYRIMPEEKEPNALKNADKYKWHDLRKNPNYLPMQKTEVLIKTKFGVFFASYYNTYYDLVSCFATRSGFPYNSEEVIAWKYIEPLEGGEE